MKAEIGSISTATMRQADLIPRFAEELEKLDEEGIYSELSAEAKSLKTYEDEIASAVLEDLFEALQDFAPEGSYFGAHVGDGADYGFWEPENHGEEA